MWTNEQPFVNDEHREIYEATKDIPGWQAPGDSHRLYEMAYKAGDVILEIGMFGGRSATVELRGGLAAPERQTPPLYFGVDIAFSSVMRTLNTLEKQNLQQHALAFHGDIEQFFSRIKIQPTMVFVDGDHLYEGVKKDLDFLSSHLVPETPVLCHDYWNTENDTGEIGVRKAVDEFVANGWAKMIGKSGCSAFLVTTDQCTGVEMEPWSQEQFAQMRSDLLQEYLVNLYQNMHAIQQGKENKFAA